MKTRAAVAWKAGEPLDHRDHRHRRPEGRRGAGRDHGDRHLPHRRLHAVGRRPGRHLPGHPRPRGRRHRARGRRRRHLAESRRSRHPALHAGMPAVQNLSVAPLEPVHRHPRHAGQRPDAGRHQPLPLRRRRRVPLHGLLDLREFHRAAGDRARQGARGRALRQDLLHRLRRHHRHRRRHQHRESLARRQCRGVRARRHRAQRHPGRPHGRRRQDHRHRPQSGAAPRWPRNSA